MTLRDNALDCERTQGAEPADQPRWLSVADALRAAIAAGRFRLGTRLPSERKLAEEFDVSRATVVSALNVLRSEGLIDSRHRAGSWIRPSR